jgi:hypothetical protein
MWDVAEVADVDVEVMEEETPSRSTPKEPSRRRFESAPPRPAPTPTPCCEEEEGPASSVAPPKSPALERGEESFSARDLLSSCFPTLVVAGAQEEALIALF